jgi:hypothetical protein
MSISGQKSDINCMSAGKALKAKAGVGGLLRAEPA